MMNKTKLREKTTPNVSNLFHPQKIREEELLSIVAAHQSHKLEAIFLLNQREISRRYLLLQHLLPKCTIHYAIKSCPVDGVIEILHALGSGFDVASMGEIRLLQEHHISAEACIHTHPIKSNQEIEQAINAGLKTFVIDNEDELIKFISYKKEVKLMLRLAFANDEAAFDLSSKFGMMPALAVDFIIKACARGYRIEGLCFHVGSQMNNNAMYLEALAACKEIFDTVGSVGIHLNTLDIGGGFPFNEDESELFFKAFFDPINAYLDTHFANVHCITEPGRFISASAGHLIVQIIGKSKRNGVMQYYCSDGLYGCLTNVVCDIYLVEEQMSLLSKKYAEKFKSVLFGPTCDSQDVIAKDIELPLLDIGDMIHFSHCGAYSISNVTRFNHLSPAKIVCINL